MGGGWVSMHWMAARLGVGGEGGGRWGRRGKSAAAACLCTVDEVINAVVGKGHPHVHEGARHLDAEGAGGAAKHHHPAGGKKYEFNREKLDFVINQH